MFTKTPRHLFISTWMMKNKFSRILLLLNLLSLSCCYSQNISFNLLWQKKAPVNTMKFLPYASMLITGGISNCDNCGQLQVWRVNDSTLTATISKQTLGVPNAVDVSNNGRTILSGHGSVYCTGGGEGGDCHALWSGLYTHFINGKEKKFLNTSDIIYSVAYSPDNSIIAAGTGYNNTGEIRIYDSGFNLLRILPGDQYETDGLAFTPDGNYLISGGNDGTVKIWNYKTGALIRTMMHGDYLNGGAYLNVDVSSNGQYIASAGRGYNMVTKIWRLSDGQLVYTLPINNYGFTTVKFSPDGNYVFAGTSEYDTHGTGWFGNIFIWRLSDGALVKKLTDKDGAPASGGIRTLALSSASTNYLAYSVNGKLKVFSVNYTNNANNESLTKVELSNAPFSSSAYPNPFKSSTNIRYNLSANEHVLLEIYNAAGSLITVLINADENKGLHDVSFNAKKLNAGLYYYKLQTKTNSEIKKIILLK